MPEWLLTRPKKVTTVLCSEDLTKKMLKENYTENFGKPENGK